MKRVMFATTERWVPKAETLILDGIKPNEHRLFRYIITRNGHNVALFGGLAPAEVALRDRRMRFPADDWGLVDRESIT